MAKKQFKAESKRLLELMINSIYTNREIFLRELISNASDATDKRYYNALQQGGSGLNRDELFIELTADKEARTLTLSDHGCGMTKEELEQNLGTIAKSGSLDFKKNNEAAEDIDIIGQFGVGFYAAFMVAKHVEVVSRSMDTDEVWSWKSDGSDGYTVEQATRSECGTTIILTLKDNTEQDNYDEFLEAIKELHKDEEDPGFMFQDYECPNFIETLGLISECYLSKEIYNIANLISDLNYDYEVLDSFFDCFGIMDLNDAISRINDCYYGKA